MKTRLTSVAVATFFAMALAVTAVPLQAEEPVVVSFRSHPKALASCDFLQRLTALPEWEPFFSAFTSAVDKGLGKELTREKLETKLPKGIVDDIQRAIDKGLTTRSVIEGLFKHVDAVICETHADFDNVDIEAKLRKFVQMICGGQHKADLDLDGFLALLIDANPRDALKYLDYLREGKDFKYLRNDPDGDFVVRFDFEFHGQDIEFAVAGLKLSGEKRYAVLISGERNILNHYDAFKTGRYAALDTSKPFKELALEETCFRVLERQGDRLGWDSTGTEILGKIKRLSVSFNDESGVSQLAVNAEMRAPEDARQVRDIAGGLIALAQLARSENTPNTDFLKSIKIETENEKVSLVMKLDNPELWKLIAQALDQATKEIKKKM